MTFITKHMIFFTLFLACHVWTFPSQGAWHTDVVTWNGRVGEYCSLALDSADAPRIAYYNASEYGLYYAWQTGTNWMTERVEISDMRGKFCCLAFDSNDRPGISYYDQSNERLLYSFNPGSGWEEEIVEDGENLGGYTSLVFDSADRPHIGYCDFRNNDLQYAYFYAGSWIFWDLGVPGYCSDLVLAPAGGFPHMCSMWPISVNRSNLYYTHNTSSGWESETVLDTGNPGVSAKIALDGAGHPMIAHRDASDGNLELLSIDQHGNWVNETVDPGPFIDGYLDLAVDSRGWPHISYHDAGYGHLMYARWDGSAWRIETVDTDGTQGYYSSIAIDSADNPHIAYYDSGRRDLRYAWWTPEPDTPYFIMIMPDIDLQRGDTFQLVARGGNPGADPLPVDLYILLDVFGAYWFYPGWTQELNFESRTMDPGSTFEDIILSFTWPPGTGSASGLYFHGALLHQGSFDIVDIDSIEWGYSE